MPTPAAQANEKPQRVAVLGGGLGSLVTALELTRPGVNLGKYDVTVYQMGHRLGGKGASGRNAALHHRNEEHGLHVWLGFYENAFRLMREVLAEWQIPAGHPWETADPKDRWTNAFHPHTYAPLTERRDGRWEIWQLNFPIRNNGMPGDGAVEHEGLLGLLMRLKDALLDIFETGLPGVLPGALPHHDAPKLDERAKAVRAQFPGGIPTAGGPLSEKAGCLSLLGLGHLRLARLAEEMCDLTVEELLTRPEEPLRRIGIVLNLGWALMRGLLRNFWSIWRGTLDVLDDIELRTFLKKNGASTEAVNAPITSAIYDAIFAWEEGDNQRERLAAGAGIRCLLRIFFSYKHALSWKMQAGMGDTIFTPMYEVLKARGVRFEFFHEVQDIKLSKDKKRVEKILVGRQVTLNNGAAEYLPLVTVQNLGCWPATPHWDQIVEAAAIQAGGHNLEHANNGWPSREVLTLQRGADFDHVVLGISLAALPAITRELCDKSPPFARMLKEVKTVRTQAWQAWLTTDAAGLGWTHPAPVLSNFMDPINTWADMTFLLPREDNPPTVKSVHYFCGPMQDAVPEAQASQHVAQNVADLKKELANSLWPGALAQGDFNPALMEHEYLRTNTNASDRYVLTLPGTTQFRLHPGKSGFSNLTLTGDWTRNQFNVGCVEATVMAGRFAAQAISGWPKDSDIAYSRGP